MKLKLIFLVVALFTLSVYGEASDPNRIIAMEVNSDEYNKTIQNLEVERRVLAADDTTDGAASGRIALVIVPVSGLRLLIYCFGLNFKFKLLI